MSTLRLATQQDGSYILVMDGTECFFEYNIAGLNKMLLLLRQLMLKSLREEDDKMSQKISHLITYSYYELNKMIYGEVIMKKRRELCYWCARKIPIPDEESIFCSEVCEKEYDKHINFTIHKRLKDRGIE